MDRRDYGALNMAGFNRVLVFGALLAACSGSAESELFGASGPQASPNGETPERAGPDAEEDPSSPDGGAGKRDGGSRDAQPGKDGATEPEPPAAKNPFDGIGTLVKLGSGYGALEGPLWRPNTSSLLFSDLSGNAIERFAPPGTFTTYRYPSGGSNGLAVDAQGQLVVCERNNRRVTRTLSSGTVQVIADEYQGAYFNAPNDAVVRSDGTVYFTDPDYSINGYKELTFNGVFRVAPDGTVSLVTDDLAKPNGIALSPNEKTLYVTDEKTGFIRAYDVAQDGSTSAPRKFADATNPDGIAVDDDGNLYTATIDGVVVFKPDGTSWGTIAVPKQPANCAFGGANRKTLFITAADTLYQIEMTIPGPA